MVRCSTGCSAEQNSASASSDLQYIYCTAWHFYRGKELFLARVKPMGTMTHLTFIRLTVVLVDTQHLHIYSIKWIKVLICKSLRGLRQFTTWGPAHLFTAGLASHSSGIKHPQTPKFLFPNSWRRNSTENRTQTSEFLSRKTCLCPSVSSHQSELRAPSVKPTDTQKNPHILIHPCMSY